MHLCKSLQWALKIVSNTQVFVAQKDAALLLVVDELVSALSLKLVDELDEVAVTVLAEVIVPKSANCPRS